jgi:hypothetical protein
LVVLEEKLLAALKAEGLTDLELACIATNAESWSERAPGFEEVSSPILIDTDGVFYVYGAASYEVILIDRRGRLVTKETYSDEVVDTLKQRIRELHAE